MDVFKDSSICLANKFLIGSYFLIKFIYYTCTLFTTKCGLNNEPILT